MPIITTSVVWTEAEKAVLALADTCWQGMSSANALETAFPEYARQLSPLAIQDTRPGYNGAYGQLSDALSDALDALCAIASLHLAARSRSGPVTVTQEIKDRMLSTGEDATATVTKLITEGTIKNV